MNVRDPDFWNAVASHPAVAPHVAFGEDLDLSAVLENPRCLPFRSEHGGYLLFQLDGLGRVYELHTMFTPEGWGREALEAAKAMFEALFRTAQIVVTAEVEGNRRSQPPRSFGFVPAGDFETCPLPARTRTWALTKAAWEASPARRRMVN